MTQGVAVANDTTFSLSSVFTVSGGQSMIDEDTANSQEIEGKFIANLPTTLKDIENFLAKEGLLEYVVPERRIITRQLDTANRELLKKGITLRIRGECPGLNLREFEKADICLKAGEEVEFGGVLVRREFEAEHLAGISMIDLDTLRQKYPKNKYPELHEMLSLVKERDLQEHFRIDCVRRFLVVGLPPELTGIPDKTVYFQVCLDQVTYALDLPGMNHPWVFHQDHECEYEIGSKACEHDPNIDKKYSCVTPSLTLEEADRAMRAMTSLLVNKAAPNQLTTNIVSKANRGFQKLDELQGKIPEHLKKRGNKRKRRGRGIRPAFKAVNVHPNGVLKGRDGHIFEQLPPDSSRARAMIAFRFPRQ